MVTAVPTIAVFPDEKLTLEQRIEKWVWHYCRTLEENYKQYHIRSMERMSSDYSNQQLEDVKNGTANLMRFVVTKGRKYFKITSHEYDTFQDRNEYKEGSVNCFVNKNTGEVYKPASYNSPHTKHVRYNLLDEDSRAECLLRADWAGGYLYLR